MKRRDFLKLAAGGAAGLIGSRVLAGCSEPSVDAAFDAGLSPRDAGHEAKPDAGTQAKLLRYASGFARPEVCFGSSRVPMERGSDGWSVAAVGVGGSELIFFIRDAETGAEDHPPGGGDYRLAADLDEAWLEKGTVFDVDPRTIGFEIIDAHTHPYDRLSDGSLVYASAPLLATLKPNGIGMAITSVKGTLSEQRTNVGGLCRENPWLVPLVWVDPQRDSIADVESMLTADGFRGLKFHPTVDGYPADGSAMDPFLELAARLPVPVKLHSATDDPARPQRVAALARRHLRAKIVLVHTELGALQKGPAIDLIRDLPNVYAETSWVNPESVLEVMGALDSSRTLFGTDATVDGFEHFSKKSIANPSGEYVYSIPDVVSKVREWAHPHAFANWARLTATRLYGLRFARLA